MSEVLTDLSQSALCFANKANLFAFFRKLSQSPAAKTTEIDGLICWQTELPHRWFSGVLCERPPEGDETRLIGEIVSYFQSNKVNEYTWWLHPRLADSSWATQLVHLGFQLDDRPPGMALDLRRLAAGLEVPFGIEVQRITDLDALRVWSEVFITGYEVPRQGVDSYYALLKGLGFDQPVRHYLAFLDDQAVGSSTLFFGAGVAGIYNVATLPEARGKGIGTLLTHLPLLEAQQMGYLAATLQSSEMGLNLYSRMGFWKVCQIDHYIWKDAAIQE
jgi:GNAT superfamily N-acetyltransferase